MSELSPAQEVLECRLDRKQRVLCAVSGGLDSMCLLHLVKEMGYPVVAAHFHHGLRGAEADRDEEFVRQQCLEWGIPFAAGRADVAAHAAQSGMSVEEAGRELRYAFLRQTAQEQGCEKILTAHHADDSAETVLLNLVRGSGVRGLSGIPEERSGIVRPFLRLTRQELSAYARAHQIPHVEDETNADPEAAARNLLRLQVMPLLRQLNPRAVEHINEAARQLRQLDEELDAAAQRCLAQVQRREDRVSLPRQALNSCSGSVQSRVFLNMLDLLGTGHRDVGSVHLQALAEMVRPAGGQHSRVALPHGVTARLERGELVLERRREAPAAVPLRLGQSVRWGAYTLTLLEQPQGEGLWIGGEAPLTLAPCVPAQRMTLPGSRGSRGIKRLCVDRRISPEERDGLPAIFAGEELAAVWRLGVDTKFVPEGNSGRFVQVLEHVEENVYDEKRDGAGHPAGFGDGGGTASAHPGTGRGAV